MSPSTVEHEKIMNLLSIRDDTEERDEDEDNSKSSPNQKVWYKFSNSLFMLLHLMSKSISLSHPMAFSMVVINTLQLMSFTFLSPQFQWNQNFREAVTPTFRALTFGFLTTASGSDSVAQAGFLATFSLVLLTAGVCIWTGRQVWTSGMVHYLQVLPFLRLIMQLMTTVLYVPALSILVGAFDCSVVNLCVETGLYTVFAVLLAIVIIGFVSFNCLAAALFVNNNPESESAASQVHGRADFGYMIIRTVLTLAFTLFPDAQTIVLSMLVLVSGVLSTGIYLKHMPYLHRSTNRVVIACNGAYMWSGICLILAEFLNDPLGNTAFICFLMGLPFVVGLFALMVVLRENKLAHMELRSNLSVYQAELVLRYKFQPCASNWGDISREYREYVDTMYSNSPFILLHLSALYVFCGNNSLLSGQYVRRANQIRGKSIDHRFFIYRSFKRQQEVKNGTAGALNYMTLKHHQKRSEFYILQSVTHVQDLFKLLTSDMCTADSVFHSARKIKRSSLRARENLTELIKITKSSPRSLLLYSLYCREIQNDDFLAREIFNSAKSQFKKGRDGDSGENDSAMFTISGDESNLGIIIDASENCDNHFGHSAETLVGKNLDFLCPPPFDNGIHDRFLRQYYETADNLNPMKRLMWARHADGYVHRMEMEITPTQDGGGALTFQGRAKLLPDQQEVVAIDKTGSILFFTYRMMTAFGLRVITEKDFAVSEKNIRKFIPQISTFDFESILNQAESVKQEIDVGLGEIYLVTVKPICYPSIGLEFLQLDFQIVQPGGGNNDFDDLTEAAEQPGESRDDSKSQCSRAQSQVDDTASAYSDATSVTTRRSSSVHQVVQQRIQTENKRLVAFKLQCLGLGILFTFMIIFSYFLNSSTFSKFDQGLEVVKLSAQKTYLIIETAVAMLHQLRVIVPQTDEAAELLDLIPETVASNSDMLERIQEQILASAASHTSTQMDLLYKPNTVNEYLSDGTFSKTSMSKLLQRYIANARAFKNENQSICDTSCRYVINNGAWELVDTAHESVLDFKNSILGDLETSRLLDIGLLVISAVTTVAILYYLIIPQLLEVRRIKEDMAGALGQIPRNVLKKLSKSGSSRIEVIKQDIQRINNAGNPFRSGYPSRKETHLNNLLNSGQVSVYTGNSPAKTSICYRWSICKFFRAKSKVSPGSGLADKRRGISSFILSILKLALPLLLIVGYFVVVLYLFTQVQYEADRHISASHAASIRWVAIQRMHFSVESPRGDEIEDWSRWSEVSTPEDEVAHNETRRSRLFLDQVIDQEEVILYGTEDTSANPLIQKSTSPDLYELLFVDGCTPITECMQMKHDNIMDILLYDLDFGLDVTMSRMVQRSEGVLRGDEVNGGIFSFVSMFALSAAMKKMLELYSIDIKGIETTAQTNILIGALCCTIMVLFVFSFMIQLFKRINDEVVDAQSLLLVLPTDLIQGVPSLRAMIADNEEE